MNVKVKTDDIHPQVNILNMGKLILMCKIKKKVKSFINLMIHEQEC